ncbi:hypothetical protein O8I31_00620 [Campylobacter lari]|uniref:hypothetical protein n=1 Tax=Campylobacter lari TaxID=201 RepID=UPI00372CD038
MNKIDSFIDGLIEKKDYFLNNIKFFNINDVDINNDTLRLIRDLQEVKYINLIYFVKKKLKEEDFCLFHPIYNIKTKALCSFYDNGIENIILMSDDKNIYPWIIIQQNSFINYIITKDTMYSIFNHWNTNVFANISKLKQIVQSKNFTFVLSNCRPYHYFMHQYFHYLVFKNSKLLQRRIRFINAYYTSNKLEKYINDNIVILFYFIPIDLVFRNFRKKISSKLSIIENEVLQSYKNNISQDEYDLVLWIGIPGERRLWANDLDVLIFLLKSLSRCFNKIQILIDGMTNYENVEKTYPNNIGHFNMIYSNVKEYFSSIVECLCDLSDFDKIHSKTRFILFKNLSGMCYKEKIIYCRSVDVAITEASTTMITPVILCRKPSIIFFGSEGYRKQAKAHAVYPNQIVVDEKYIYCHKMWKYYINKEYIYNVLIQIIKQIDKNKYLRIKNNGVDCFELPSRELFEEYCELKEKIDELRLNFRKILDKKNNELKKYKIDIANCINNLEFVFNKKQLKENDFQQLKLLIEEIKQGKKIVFYSSKSRIQNQLSYKLGQAMIVNSKSFLGYIKMPFVLSYIKDKHTQEQKIYQEKIKKDPSLKLPPLESYPDYKEALKEKECLTYKLGEALIKANKTWYKGGYVKLIFEIGKLKKEFTDKL